MFIKETIITFINKIVTFSRNLFFNTTSEIYKFVPILLYKYATRNQLY